MTSSFGSNWIRNVFGTRPLDSDESICRNIVNILETPAIMLDYQKNKIIIGNAEFCKLTSYSQQDLVGQPLELILDNSHIMATPNDAPVYQEIQSRYKKEIGVYMKKKIIDPSGGILLLMMVPEETYHSGKIKIEEKIFFTINQLMRLIEVENLSIALNKAISLIADYLQTDYAMIYQVSVKKPIVEKRYFYISENIFPERLLSSDLLLENSTNIWSPGLRVTSELHKIARSNGFAYLASIVLGPGNSASGFLVIAHSDTPPSKNMRIILEVFGSALSSIYQYFILVSTLKKQLREHRWRENLSENIFNQSLEGIILLDKDFRVIALNPVAEKLLCYSSSEAVGQPIENVFVGPNNFVEIKRKVEYENTSYMIGRIDVHNRGGETVYLDVKITPFYFSGRKVFTILMNDLSETEEYRQKAEQLEKHAKLGEVTAVFAHDVRNPINNISMGVQILARKYASDDQTNEIAHRMIQDCDRLTALMESVLAYTKPFEPKFEKTNIGFLIDRVINRLRPKMLKSGVTEFVQKPDKIPDIMADTRSLDQVFTNLITNAIDAMETNQGGTLAIHIEETNEITNHPQIVVKVIDSGPGIPEEVRGKIFEPFVTTKKKGTGLGLAICKRNITAHKGNITVTSFPGGTVFNVFLPIKQGD